MKKEIFIIITLGLIIAITSSCNINETEKELIFEENAQVLCYIPEYVVYGVPNEEKNKSYSFNIRKMNVSDGKIEDIGKVEYVGVYSNICTYQNDKIYICFAYDINFIDNKNVRLCEIDIKNNTINVIFEFRSDSKLVYTIWMENERILLHGIENVDEGVTCSKVFVVNTSEKRLEKEIEYEDLKPVVAGYDDGNIYIIHSDGDGYSIDVYDNKYEIAANIDLSEINYFFYDADDKLSTVQYLETKNDTFVITLFGSSSIVLRYNQAKKLIEEKYIGDKLMPWNVACFENSNVRIYSTGKENYEIDFEKALVSKYAIDKMNDETYYTVLSYDYKNILITSRTKDNTGKTTKKYIIRSI